MKVYKPVTSSRRGLVNIDRRHLWKGGPEKSLIERIKRSGGRNNQGRNTAKHRGGGSIRMYRRVDFKRKAHDIEGTISRIEYDPNRSAFIALVERENKKQYVVATEDAKPGDKIGGDEVRSGSCLMLSEIPTGTRIHNIEMRPGSGAKLVRSAGVFAQVLGQDGDQVLVRLTSGQIKKLSKKCTAIIGVVSNHDHMNKCDAKAGRSRWKGRRPHVRGMAMNRSEHKMGGGRGHVKGRCSASAKGILAKGFKTRRNKRPRELA